MNEDRPVGRKIKDTKGNIYVFELPTDVLADSIEDILLSATQGITRMVAYKLDNDVYRTIHNEAIGSAAGQYNHFKWRRIDLCDADTNQLAMPQDEFSEMIHSIIEQARAQEIEQSINQPRVVWRGSHVKTDGKGSLYIEKEIKCHIKECSNIIKGRVNLSRSPNGEISRAQQFEPYDKKAGLAKPRSKNWLCSEHAVRTIPVPVPEPVIEVEQPPIAAPEVPVEPVIVVEQPTEQHSVFDALLTMSGPESEVDPIYLKGVLHGVLLMREAAKRGEA